MLDLKNCPFCGGKAEWANGLKGDNTPWRYIACEVCEATAPYPGDEPAAWNRRALQAVGPEPVAWEDREDEMSDAITASHPVNSKRHDTYQQAMELVGNRHSKGALVALVNHLLIQSSSALVATPPAERVVEAAQPAETYYTKGKDAEYFEKLSDKDFAWALTCASQDLNDSDENVSQWMPVTALLSDAADRISALATKPAVKDDETVVAILDERQKRAEQVHDRILAARDNIRSNLSPDSPAWLRDAFNKLHEAHHIMGGDPFDMHMRAALAAKDGRS